MSIPIHIIVARIKRLSLPQQIFYLRVKLNEESPRSVRHYELQHLLSERIVRQLRRENKEKVA